MQLRHPTSPAAGTTRKTLVAVLALIATMGAPLAQAQGTPGAANPAQILGSLIVPALNAIGGAPVPPIPAPLPNAANLYPNASTGPILPRGPTGDVDRILKGIAKNMQPQTEMIDPQAEMLINRDIALSRSTGQMLRPVGFVQIGEMRMIYVSEDGQRLLRLKEGSRLGLMKVKKISENGVEYEVAGKTIYAPLAFTAVEPPKTSAMGSGGSAGAVAAAPTAVR